MYVFKIKKLNTAIHLHFHVLFQLPLPVTMINRISMEESKVFRSLIDNLFIN